MLRRRFLEITGLAAGAAALRPGPLSATTAHGAPSERGISGALDRVGLQLYTVRSLMAESVERTLELVAETGYREVEFAGYFDRSPGAIRSTLDGLGLTAPSMHIGLPLLVQSVEETLEAADAIGHRYVVVPWLGEEYRNPDGYRSAADEMNAIAERCAEAGVGVGYHNHAFEFEPLGDTTGFDILLDRWDPALVTVEIDLFWIRAGGHDPLAYFESHPGRFTQCHIKDMSAGGDMVDVGAGVIDFAEILAQSERAGLEHFYVEHDNPADPADSIRRSYLHLADL